MCGCVAGDWIQPVLCHARGDKFQFAGRGWERALKRHKGSWIVQPHPAAHLKLVESYASQGRMPTLKNLTCHRFVTVKELRIVQTHLAREAPKDLSCRQALPGRRHCRFIPGDVQMPVCNQ